MCHLLSLQMKVKRAFSEFYAASLMMIFYKVRDLFNIEKEVFVC